MMKVKIFLKVFAHPAELARLAAQVKAAIGSVDAGVFSSQAAKPHQTDLDIQGRHTPPISIRQNRPRPPVHKSATQSVADGESHTSMK